MVALQEKQDSSRIIKYLAHEGVQMRFQIGSHCVIHAIILKAQRVVPAKRIARNVVGHTLSFIGQ